MPLRVETGITLNPKKPTPIGVGTAHHILGAPDGSDSVLEPVSLPVKAVFQEGALWCWAACVAMVLAYYQKPQTQCEIVTKKVTAVDCGREYDLKREGCDVTEVKSTWQAMGFQSPKSHSKIPGSNTGPITLQFLKEQLAAGMPVEAGIVWLPLGSGHAVLVKGWSATSPESLIVNDPLKFTPLGAAFTAGEGRMTYQELATAHDHGIWAYAWTNLDGVEN